MNIRQIIREELENIIYKDFCVQINEGFSSNPDRSIINENQRPLPRKFDHLKWKLSNNQKYYLEDLCDVNPESLRESDIKSASKFLGIPEKNVKSILNTYNEYNPLKEGGLMDSQESKNSRLTFGNKAANAIDIGIDNNTNSKPIRSGVQIKNNPPLMSKKEMESKYNANMLDRVLYKNGNEHPSKVRERIYESLAKSLMLYLLVESKPSDINLRYDNKIQLDFELVIKENEFNKLSGGPNYENELHNKIKDLIAEFNNKFGSKYVIYEHIKINNGFRIFIEHNVTNQIDMSQDSVTMMKKWLLPRIITGGKIQTNDPSVISLMGLDAGDTTWLYGQIGQPMQSGVLSKVHKGRA